MEELQMKDVNLVSLKVNDRVEGTVLKLKINSST